MIITPDNTLYSQYEFATSSPAEFLHPAIIGGFGSGKTESIPLRWLFLIDWRAVNQKIKCSLMVIEPTYEMIRDILVPTFDKYFNRHGIKHTFHKSYYNYSIRYKGYTFTALLRSADKPSSLTGKNLTDVIADEFDKIKSIKNQKDVWNECIARTRQADYGTVSPVTTPEGYRYTYEMYGKELKPGFKLIRAITDNNKFLPKTYIENLYRQYSPELVQQYIKAQFINLTQGKVYYSFSRETHIRPIELRNDLPICLTFDFNVNPMTTSICQIVNIPSPKTQDKYINVFKTINTRNSNTEKQCLQIKDFLRDKNNGLIIYGDATNQKRTESNYTNWQIVRSHFPLATYKVPSSNPPVMDRINAVNSKLINSLGQIGIFINDNGCEPLISDFEKIVWREGKNEVDTTTDRDLTHNSDNIGYLVWQEFPLRHKIKSSVESR